MMKNFIDGLSMFVIRWSCSFLKGNTVNYRSARTTSSVVDEVGFIEISADDSVVHHNRKLLLKSLR